MKPLRRAFAALERKPWPLALAAGLGFTLFVASAVALLGSSELLDALVAMGDAQLFGVLGLLFVASACTARVAFRRRRRPEEDLDEIVVSRPPPAAARPVSEGPPGERPAKAYLR
jgi:hypothetical protein